ncbi:MAG: agmatinase [Pseudomonadota bacterium]
MTRPIAILGLPQDNNSSFLQGPALAPARIREAFHSASANMFTETGHDLGADGAWRDAGDLLLDGLSGQVAYDAIYAGVSDTLESGDPLISLGGDHSVAFPAIMAHADRYEDLSILQVDAHADLYDDFDGNPFSHASPFARLMETERIRKLVQVGIRTLTAHQREQVERFNIDVHEMSDLSRINDIHLDGPMYLSLDLDGLDPAFAPGVGHHEPGGLSTRMVIDLIHGFGGQLIGGDIVELNPHRDLHGMTAMVAGKLLKEMMGRIIKDMRG